MYKMTIMNKTYFIQTLLLLAIFSGSSIVAQTPQAVGKKGEQEKSTPTIGKDLNANGVDDTKEFHQSDKKRSLRSNDKFIDTNGDGICDNREQGLGFRRGKTQSSNQSVKRQQGKHK